jgi:hypothetical protein
LNYSPSLIDSAYALVVKLHITVDYDYRLCAEVYKCETITPTNTRNTDNNASSDIIRHLYGRRSSEHYAIEIGNTIDDKRELDLFDRAASRNHNVKMGLNAIIGSVDLTTATTTVAAIATRSIRSEEKCTGAFLENETLIAWTRRIEEGNRLIRFYSLICDDTVISSHWSSPP